MSKLSSLTEVSEPTSCPSHEERSPIDDLHSCEPSGGRAHPSDCSEKRGRVRFNCYHRVHSRIGEHTAEAVVIDIGLGGLRLALPEALEVGQSVAITTVEAEDAAPKLNLRSRVVWCRPNPRTGTMEAGLQFQEDPENLDRCGVSGLLHALGAEQRVLEERKHIRAATDLPASIETPEGRLLVGGIQDLGLGGAQLRCHLSLDGNLQVKFGPYGEFEALRLTAQVRNLRFDSACQVWVHGLKFCKTPPTTLKLLTRYVLCLLKAAAWAEDRPTRLDIAS